MATPGRNFRVVKMTGVLKTEMAALASLWSCTRSHFFWGGGVQGRQAVTVELHGRMCSLVEVLDRKDFECQDKELILFWVSWCQEQLYGAHQI